MAFEGGVELKDWRSAVTVPLYKDKGESSISMGIQEKRSEK